MGPNFQVGAYWDDKPDGQAFFDLLTWLVESKGYRHASPVSGVLAFDGRLPFFGCFLDSRENIVREQREIRSLAELKKITDWFPAAVLLHPTKEGVPLELEYAIADEAAHRAGDKRVVAVTFDGADCNLLDNVGRRRVSGTTWQRAQRTGEWIATLMRALFEELGADFAACYMESFLPQPASLLSHSCSHEFLGICLAGTIVTETEFNEGLVRIPVGSPRRFTNAFYLASSKRNNSTPELIDAWRDQVRTWMQSWLRRKGRSARPLR